jgi:RNA polymerase sigma-70 factor (ECF subfamily)
VLLVVPVVVREGRVDEGEAPPARGSAERAAAFTRLLDRNLDASYRLAAVILGNRIEAEEATHDAAVRAWQRWSPRRDPERLDAWFGRILVNVSRDRLRRRRWVDPPLAQTGAGSERDAFTDSVEQEALRAAIAELSSDHRTVIALRYLGDLTVEQIAERTGKRVGTVQSRLHYGLRALRAAYNAANRPGSRARPAGISDEHFEQDLRDAVQSLAPSGAPDSLRQRAAAIPSTAPSRSRFARWGVIAGGAVAAAAAVAVLVLALALKPVVPSPDGSPNPSASVPSETGDFAPISIAFWSIGSGVAGGPGADGQGVIELTTDGGRTWTLSYLAPGPVTHVTVAGTADAWAIVDCQHRVREPCTPLAHTGDGGLSWSVIEADEVTVSFIDALRGWGLTSGSPGVVQTDDGGQNWASPSQPCQAPFTTPVALSLDPS